MSNVVTNRMVANSRRPRGMKPLQWNVVPKYTAAPGLWHWFSLDMGAVWPFWASKDDVLNAIPGSPFGNWSRNNNETFEGGKSGQGVLFLNGSTGGLVNTTPNNTVWEKDAPLTCFVVATLKDDSNGSQGIVAIGGNADGFTVGYRNAPEEIRFATNFDSNNVEIGSTSTFVPEDKIVAAARLDNSDGSMALFINGMKEATGSNGTGSVFTPLKDPTVGGESTTNGPSAFDFGGTIEFLAVSRTAIPDRVIMAWSNDPFAMIRPGAI